MTLDPFHHPSRLALFEPSGAPPLAGGLRKAFPKVPLTVFELGSLQKAGKSLGPQDLLIIVATVSEHLSPVNAFLESNRCRGIVFVDPSLISEACAVLTSLNAGIWPLLEADVCARLLKRLRLSSAVDHSHRETLEAIGEAIIETDLQGGLLDANQTAQRLLGLSEVTFDQYRIDDFNGDAVTLMSGDVVRSLLGDGRHEFEQTLKPLAGETFPGHLAMTLMRSQDGSPERIIVTLRDISARVNALRRNHEAQQRLAFHVQRTPLAFVEFDCGAVITSWNPAAERVFGWKADEVIGRSIEVIVPRAARSEVAEVFQHILQQTGGKQSTTENLTKDGRTIICEWHNTALLDDTGEIVGVASLANDITDRVRVEEELRTSRVIAEEASRSKDEFLTLMNHEMRTPLNSIIGFADLLRDCDDAAERLTMLETIDANARTLLDLVDNVLAYSRLDSGRVFLAMRETDLEVLLHEVSEMARLKAEEKGLTFQLEIQPGMPTTVFADHNELRNLLLKLLDNAVKFTSEGGVLLRVRSQSLRGSQRSRNYRFEVIDSGPGVPAEAREHIFQSFRQADAATRRPYGGSGLGLALCRKIAELMDGRIWYEPNPEGGSMFITEIGLTVVDGESSTNAPFPETNSTSPFRFFAEHYPVSILLVASSRREQTSCARMLDNMGYQLSLACDLQELAECLQKGSYELVLIDLQAPETVLRQARQLVHQASSERGVAPPMTVLIAHGKAITRAPFRSQLFDGILERPVRQSVLQKLLRMAATRTGATAAFPPVSSSS